MKNTAAGVILVSIMGLFLYNCSDMNEHERIVPPKFHTPSDEGMWVNQSPSHIPIIAFTAKDEIDVRVPLHPSKTPYHYIEAIVLMDGSKEIEAKKISFSYNEPHAHFTLPDPERGNYKIVVKCNLHDMWMAPVVVPVRGESKKKK
jgi:desulfoferrodoxin (superoxide reductase-like protein)